MKQFKNFPPPFSKMNIMAILIPLLMAGGCDNGQDGPGTVTVNEECKALEFENEAGLEQTVKFHAPSAWTTETTENWLDIVPASGEAGDNEITVRTSSINSAQKARSAEITIISGESSATVSVIQKGMDGTFEEPEEDVSRLITKININTYRDASYEHNMDYYLKYTEDGKIYDITLVDRIRSNNDNPATFKINEYSHRWLESLSDNSVTLYAEDYPYMTETSLGTVEKYSLEIPLDESGNQLRMITNVSNDEVQYYEIGYNEDHTLKAWIVYLDTYQIPVIRFTWDTGNLVSCAITGSSKKIAVTPSEYTASGVLDLNFLFLMREDMFNYVLYPPASFGTMSTNLPESITFDDETIEYEYEFDEYGRLTKATEMPRQDNHVYTFYYDEQTPPDVSDLLKTEL